VDDYLLVPEPGRRIDAGSPAKLAHPPFSVDREIGMKALKAILAISSTAIGGCAVTPEWNQEATESVQPMRDMHRACMVANATSLDDGSRNPPDIVDTIEGLCAPLLEPMRVYIEQEGFGEAFADSYVTQVMTDNRRDAQDAVVRVRTEARRSP
jgi:hypothetical protein